MSSSENKDSPPKEEKKESTNTQPEKPAPVKSETDEPTAPVFEKGFIDIITNEFPDDVDVAFIKETRTKLNVKKEKILDVAKFINDKTPFDHAESVTGTDFPEEKEIEVTYHLGSYTDNRYSKQILALSTRASREDEPIPGNDSTKLPSLRDIFYSVEFHERECFEMLGVYFDGHPDNRRLLLPEDWADIPPMRKDFKLKGR
jgi:NADH-quinone oxidoreductase subunit C